MPKPDKYTSAARLELSPPSTFVGKGAIPATSLVPAQKGAVDRAECSSDYIHGITGFTVGEVRTDRHRTAYIEIGPKAGPLMVFVHGHPELGIIWRSQMEHFAEMGWRCVAPDMRGYGASSVPTEASAYTVREIVGDMVELHDALGGAPAVWVGHDWGSPIVCDPAPDMPSDLS